MFMMGWALLTCYSRVYLGVHYPGDLIAGTLVGLIAAYIVYRLFLKVSGYKTMKKVPHIYAPILVGGLTIVGILIYSTVMILQAQTDDLSSPLLPSDVYLVVKCSFAWWNMLCKHTLFC